MGCFCTAKATSSFFKQIMAVHLCTTLLVLNKSGLISKHVGGTFYLAIQTYMHFKISFINSRYKF